MLVITRTGYRRYRTGSWFLADPPIISAHTAETGTSVIMTSSVTCRAGAASNGHTIIRVSRDNVTSSVTWSVTHAGSRLWSSNWPNIEKPPGRLSPHFIINTVKESWHQIQNEEHRGVLGTLWVKFHKRLSPMFHLEHTVSKPSKSDKSIRAWAHSASPLFSISGTCAEHSVKLWLAASVWYDISLLRCYPLPPSLALSHSPRINALFSHFESGSSSSNSAATDCYYRITIYFRLL